MGLSLMPRLSFLQHWFALSDPGAEDALHESPALRGFRGIDSGRAPAPEETTILNFRHLLEQHDLCGQMLDVVNDHLAWKGVRTSTGTIVDATIIAAPSSVKNAKKERDPPMHQTKKGNQHHFGAKAHIGVDSKSGLAHSVRTPAAGMHDKHMLPDLRPGDEKKVWGDGGCQGQTEVIREAAPAAEDMTNRPFSLMMGVRKRAFRGVFIEENAHRSRSPCLHLQGKWSRRAKNPKGEVNEEVKKKNRARSRVRARVEWPFRILKRVFGYTKVRYRGIGKNQHSHLAAFALVNVYLHRKRLLKMLPALTPQAASCLCWPKTGPRRRRLRRVAERKADNIEATARQIISRRRIFFSRKKGTT